MVVRKQTSVNRIISQYFKTSTGLANITGDYSTGNGVFKIAPTTGQVMRINRIIPYIEDTGTKFNDSNFGAISNWTTGSTEGVYIQITNGSGGVLIDLSGGSSSTGVDGIPIQTNGQWSRVCYDIDRSDNGNALNHQSVRWTFANSGTVVRLTSGEELRVTLKGVSCTGLDDFTVMAQGYYEDQWT